MTAPDFDQYRQKILDVYPHLATSKFIPLNEGWDSLAIDVDDQLIFRFPRHPVIRGDMIREAALLDAVRRRLTMRVPTLQLFGDDDELFSMHEKIKGEHLLAADYDLLPEAKRQTIAEQLALFYSELHAIDISAMRRAGAMQVLDWTDSKELRFKALPLLPPDLREAAVLCLEAFDALQEDPCGDTFGFFDGHGWNMAFDRTNGVLNGIYDFADAGFGPLHREFALTGFISYDLSERVVQAYERLTGRRIDRTRLTILSGTHRLCDVADRPDDPAMIPFVETWAASKDAQEFLREATL